MNPIRTIHEVDGRLEVHDVYANGELELPEIIAALEKLREPFDITEVQKLPKPTGKNAWEDQPKSLCEVCHRWHPVLRTIHLDYVGHAKVTDRLLEVDPFWEWDFLAVDAAGMPIYDNFNGLWITLTVCGVTRKGYGHAGNKTGGDAVKEIIGDALRNAAMRFGVGLQLWMGDIQEADDPGPGAPPPRAQRASRQPAPRGTGKASPPREQAARPEPPDGNQAALDSLQSVCDKNGLDTREVADRWRNDKKLNPDGLEIIDASPDDILDFSAILLAEMEPRDDSAPQASGVVANDGGGDGAPVGDGAANDGDEAQASEGKPLF